MVGISKADLDEVNDVYVDYELEQVMFRWEASSRMVYRKFYGEDEALLPIEHSNRLFNEALSLGEEISAAEYKAGRAVK